MILHGAPVLPASPVPAAPDALLEDPLAVAEASLGTLPAGRHNTGKQYLLLIGIAHLFTGSEERGGRRPGQSGGVVNGHPAMCFRYGRL